MLRTGKPNMKRSLCGSTFAVVLLVVLSGCGGNNVSSTKMGSFPYIQMAPSAPPPAQQEEKPNVGTLSEITWKSGYWRYTGSDFSWVSGEYISKPHPTAVWSPDRWELRSYGWTFIPGCWM